MFFFFFSNSPKDTQLKKENDAVFKLRNRPYVLEIEAQLLVLRLLQLRDYCDSNVFSVKQNGNELPKLPELKDLALPNLSVEGITKLTKKIGYDFRCKLPENSRCNIEVNNKKYGIRCFNHTERPLINHSTREKYERLCKKSGANIRKLDDAVASYWECREAGIFNEDCVYNSPLNPFLDIKDDLRKLLTYIAFHSYNISKNPDDPAFELGKIDGYIDYNNPCNEETWDILNEETFFDKIWKHLRFSFRADRGMPDRGEKKPTDESILKWTKAWTNKNGKIVYKGALHIRISRYITAINDTPTEELFSVKHKDEIKKVSINQGERDEYLLKLFLIECRKNNRPVPIGDKVQVVKNVENAKHEEIGYPERIMDWTRIRPGLLIFICQKIKAGKSGAFDKADVFVNGIGISVKSQRGAPPSIINQTARDKVLRVMKMIQNPILPLDNIVNRYWELRLNGGTEDVSGIGNHNPFTTNENGESNITVIKPLLNYFAFKGTGTRESSAPASYILSIGDPEDTSTWTYYSEHDFVDSVWDKLVFSIRSKGLPSVISDEIKPWVREIDGGNVGTLNVRVKK